ncbi:glutathione S-transferase T2-like [Brassica napus]|uniref:glutathione S-transferase T2-like n=1 Tax=Brassica napus TaxID=3708 RepID=UPI002078C97E|nr:glutathione S-transferase T2-like [Brassica napus]
MWMMEIATFGNGGMDEMRDFQTQLRQLKDQGNESEKKLVLLEKTEELQRLQTRVSYLTSVCNNKSDTEHSLTMANTSGYVNLLNSQTPIDLDSPEPFWFGSQGPDESGVKERRKWSPKEDKILIGAWLNTSKDHVCKQRWAKINEQVCKFVGCYDAALREQRSGQNDDDVMKAAIDIFHNDYDSKFTLDHAWRELRHDQKWCSTYLAKNGGKEKRKQVQLEVDREEEVGEPENRPVGVKAAKAVSKKKKSGREEDLSKLQGVLEVKEKIPRHKLLDRLLAIKEPLSEMETSLKLKLMSEML